MDLITDYYFTMDHEHRLAESVLVLAKEVTDLTKEFRHSMERIGRLIDTHESLKRIEITQEKIMATQTEIAAQLRASIVTINKIGDETDKLIKTVADLTAAVANQDNASDELVAASKAVSDQLKLVDDRVPDAVPVPSPVPTP